MTPRGREARRARRALVVALAPLVASAAGAGELWSAGDASLSVSGSVRELVTGTRGTDVERFSARLDPLSPGFDPSCVPVQTFPSCSAWDALGDRDAWTSLTRLRLHFDGRATGRLSAVVVADLEGRIGRRENFGSAGLFGFETGRFVDLEDEISDRADAHWRQLLYRAYLFYEGEKLEVTLGRQRVPWGVGRLWNPIDRFNAIGPLAIEADQSAGVDAVKARWIFSGFTHLEGVYAAGARGKDRAYAARLAGVVRDVDYGLVAGVFEQAYTLGFDLAGNLGDAAGRLEVVWTDPERRVRPFGEVARRELPPYWQVVVSVDHNIDVGSGLYVLAEHLYNGNALGFGRGTAGGFVHFFQEQTLAGQRVIAPGTTDLFGHSRVVTLGEHQSGVQVGYDLRSDLRADLLTLYDWRGASASVFPSVRYSPTGWLELTLGVQLFAGPRRSEYGQGETLGFVLAEVFF